MTTFGLVAGGLVLVVLFATFVIATLTDLKVTGTSPRGIGAELRRNGSHVVRVSADGFTWNPSLPPGRDNRIYGPGTATYRTLADGQVQLDFVDASGRTGRWAGAFPAEYAEPRGTQVPSYAFIKPLAAVAGFAIGFVVASGGAAHEVAVGFGFAISAWVITAILVMTTALVSRQKAYLATRP